MNLLDYLGNRFDQLNRTDSKEQSAQKSIRFWNAHNLLNFSGSGNTFWNYLIWYEAYM